MQETWVRSLGWEDPLEEGMTSHSTILAWRIPKDGGAWQTTVHGVTKSWTQLNNEAYTNTCKMFRTAPGTQSKQIILVNNNYY